jgi:hypothetical protein
MHPGSQRPDPLCVDSVLTLCTGCPNTDHPCGYGENYSNHSSKQHAFSGENGTSAAARNLTATSITASIFNEPYQRNIVRLDAIPPKFYGFHHR